jgi:uncharacterized membrane-anchored protein
MVFFGIGVLFLLPFVLLGVALFVFWIIMLIDSITRKFKNDSDKIVWVLVNILLGLLGAIIYYFVIFIKDGKKSMKWFWWTLLVLFVIDVILIVFLLISFYAGVSAVN